jgi:hypothetical protein
LLNPAILTVFIVFFSVFANCFFCLLFKLQKAVTEGDVGVIFNIFSRYFGPNIQIKLGEKGIALKLPVYNREINRIGNW